MLVWEGEARPSLQVFFKCKCFHFATKCGIENKMQILCSSGCFYIFRFMRVKTRFQILTEANVFSAVWVSEDINVIHTVIIRPTSLKLRRTCPTSLSATPRLRRTKKLRRALLRAYRITRLLYECFVPCTSKPQVSEGRSSGGAENWTPVRIRLWKRFYDA